MLTLPQIRREVASVLRSTDEGLREKAKSLGPLMRAEAPGVKIGPGSAAPGNAANTAMLALAACVPGQPAVVGAIIERLWRAKWQPRFDDDPPNRCPISHAATLREALVTLISDPTVRKKLDFVEIVYEYEMVSLAWYDTRPSVFHPFTQDKYEAAVKDAQSGGYTRVARLPAGTFARLQGLIERPN